MDDPFEAQMAELAQARMAMPQQAAEAQKQRQLAMMQEVMQRRQIAQQALQQKYGQPVNPQQLLAQERTSNYHQLLNPGITPGVPQPPQDVGPQYTPRQKELALAMRLRSSAKQARMQATGQKLKSDEYLTSDARQERIAAGKAKQDEFRKRNIQLAARRGVLSPGAMNQAFANETIPDREMQMLKLRIMMAQAMQQRPAMSSDEIMRQFDPELYRRWMESRINRNNYGGMPEE